MRVSHGFSANRCMNGPSVIDMWLHCIPIPIFQSPKCNSHSPPPFPFQLPRTRRHFFSQTANSNSAIRYSSTRRLQSKDACTGPSSTTTLESCPYPLGRVCNKIIQYSCQRLLVLLVSVITCRLQKKMESGKQPTAAGPQRLQVSMHVRRACLPPKQLLRRCDSATIQYEWSGLRHVPMFWTGPPTVDISMTSICRR